MKKITALVMACMLVLSTSMVALPIGALARAGAVVGAPVALSSLSPDTSQGIQMLSPQNPGHFHQTSLTKGWQLGDRDAYVEYALNGRYTTLAGTLYGDDNSNNTATILIVDSTQRAPVVLLRMDVPPGAREPRSSAAAQSGARSAVADAGLIFH